MARGVGREFGPLGKALAEVVAHTVRRVIEHSAPHTQAARTEATEAHARHTADQLHPLVRPLFQTILDAESLHPVLRPVIEAMVRGRR